MGLFKHLLNISWESFLLLTSILGFSLWLVYDNIIIYLNLFDNSLSLRLNLFSFLTIHEIINFYFSCCLNFCWNFWTYSNQLNFCNLTFLTQFLDYPIFFLFALFFCFSSLFSLLCLNYLGFYGIFFLNFFILFGFWLSFLPYLTYIFQDNGFYYINIGKWMFINSSHKIYFDFYIDAISLSFAFLTLTIALFVYMFTFSYFRFEPLVDRLLILLNLFIISMIFLVCSGNLINLFLGWELIGLTSFYLINFWVNKVSTLKAAFKAYSFNKLSDFFLLLNVFLIFNVFNSVDFLTISTQAYNITTKFFNCNFLFILPVNDVICLLFLGCAFIKSAQIGAHIWLPDSMEAPVPASSLIHSATLVSAGIFLLLRFNFFIDNSMLARVIICCIGAITAFYGGFISMHQSDTKRILAYSTISHCGFLMVLVSFHIIEFTLLYLYIHGFFKAAVFMCVGNINRLSKNNQDVKQMGMYYKFLPFECIMSFIGLVNLAGLPFSLGFFIKHLLFVAIDINFYLYLFILINLIFAALTGLFYCSKLFYYVFFDFKKNRAAVYSYYNRKNLNSIFYSNTTFLSTWAIFGLFFVAYIISFYFLYIYLQEIFNYSDLNEFYKSTSFFFSFISNKALLFNFSIFNWIILIIGSGLIFINWRKINQNFNIQNYFWILYFFFFFILFF